MNNMFAIGSPIVAATLLLLIALSVATWSIVLFKLWKQLQDSKPKREFNAAFWSARDWNSAAQVAHGSNGDMAHLAQAGFAELKNLSLEQSDLNHLGAPQDVLERMLRQQVQNIQRYHERGLAELATIGSTAPFVGLFGTVWGIMDTFKGIGARGSATLAIVAPGISEALIATAAGLAAAIPAVIFYNYYLNRIKGLTLEMDHFSLELLNIVERFYVKK